MVTWKNSTWKIGYLSLGLTLLAIRSTFAFENLKLQNDLKKFAFETYTTAESSSASLDKKILIVSGGATTGKTTEVRKMASDIELQHCLILGENLNTLVKQSDASLKAVQDWLDYCRRANPESSRILIVLDDLQQLFSKYGALHQDEEKVDSFWRLVLSIVTLPGPFEVVLIIHDLKSLRFHERSLYEDIILKTHVTDAGNTSLRPHPYTD
jgi:Cdc6-like AAA superfamily ATPase